jgi:hypothetical protein
MSPPLYLGLFVDLGLTIDTTQPFIICFSKGEVGEEEGGGSRNSNFQVVVFGCQINCILRFDFPLDNFAAEGSFDFLLQ